MIRSSGTPCCISTSTAFIAEPPVAASMVMLSPSHSFQYESIPSMGSRRRTYRDAMSCGNCLKVQMLCARDEMINETFE